MNMGRFLLPRKLVVIVVGCLALALFNQHLIAQIRSSSKDDEKEKILRAHNERPSDPPKFVDKNARKTSPPQSPRAGGFVSVQVNVDANGNNIVGDAANEPSMAMNSVDPSNMVIGWRQFDTISSNFRQAGMAYTTDGGVNWNNQGPLQPGIFRSDPVLDADSDGTIYYYSLTANGNQTEFSCQMFITSDGGATWSNPIPAGGGDKQWMAIDRSGGMGNGFIYAAWSPFYSCCPSGFFTRSIDGGVNYLMPINLPEDIYWGTLSVGPDGELYVCGRDVNNDPVVIRSDNAQNGGQTPNFPQVRVVNLGGNSVFGGGPNPGGLLGQYDIATDNSEGPTRGNVYLLASVNPPGSDPCDVKFSRSTDGGLTWSTPIRINTDQTGSGRFNWFGTMSVAPCGRIDVIWNDMRDDPGGQFSAMYYSSSSDGGLTWSNNVQVTPAFNSLIGHPNQNKIGDYYDMRSTDDAVHIAYAATFNGEQDVYYLRIGVLETVAPDTLTVTTGTLRSGGLVELEASDNRRACRCTRFQFRNRTRIWKARPRPIRAICRLHSSRVFQPWAI